MFHDPPDTVEEHAIELMSSLGKEHLFVAKQPSDIDVDKYACSVITYEEAFDHSNTGVGLCLLLPKAFALQKLVDISVQRDISVHFVFTVPSDACEFETSAWLFNLLQDRIQHVGFMQNLGITCSHSRQEKYLVACQVEANAACCQVTWGLPSTVLQYVFPRDVVEKLNTVGRLQSLPGVSLIDFRRPNSCHRISDRVDVTSLTVQIQGTQLDDIESVERCIQPTIDASWLHGVAECQIKHFFPWSDKQFLCAFPHGVTMSVIDLKSCNDLELKNILVQLAHLKIRYHFMNYRRLAIFGPPSLVINLHLALLPLDVQLPIGPKQGAFTLHIIKTEPTDSSIGAGSNCFQVKFGKIGSFQYVPTQILWKDIHTSICSEEHTQLSPLVKMLRKDFGAVNFTVRWCQVDQSQQKCLCFDIDIQHEDALPISTLCENLPITIHHQCPAAENFRSEVSLTEFETRRDHWNKVITMQMVPKEGRVSHLSFEQDRKYAAKRYYDLHSTIIDSMAEYTNIITVASQPPAWFFSPKVLSLPLRECLHELNHCDNSFLHEVFTTGSNLSKVTLQQHEFAKYRNHSSWTFMYLTLGAEQIFHLKSIHHEKDEWKIRYYDELIIRTFEQSSIFVSLPPGVTVSHVLDNLEQCILRETLSYVIPEQPSEQQGQGAGHPGTLTDQFKHGPTKNQFTNGAGIPSSNTTQPTPSGLQFGNGGIKYCPPAKTMKKKFSDRQAKNSPREPATKDIPMTPANETMPVVANHPQTVPSYTPGNDQGDVCMLGDNIQLAGAAPRTKTVQQPSDRKNQDSSTANWEHSPFDDTNGDRLYHKTPAEGDTVENKPIHIPLEPGNKTIDVHDQNDKPEHQNTTEGCSRMDSNHNNHPCHPTSPHTTDRADITPGGMVTTEGCPRMVPCPVSPHTNHTTTTLKKANVVEQNGHNPSVAAVTERVASSADGLSAQPMKRTNHAQVSLMPHTLNASPTHKQECIPATPNHGSSTTQGNTIKDFLNRNKAGCPSDETNQVEETDDEVCFMPTENDASIQSIDSILLRNDLSGNLVKICSEIIAGWPCSFANADSEHMAKLAACYSINFSSHMCYAITALRVLTHAPWNDEMFCGHIRELILCAIGCGWTWKDQTATVHGRRVTTAEVSAALASYRNPIAFPPGQNAALDTAIIAVCDDLFPDHVALFFATFSVHCASCGAEGHVSVSIFDASLITMPESTAIDLAQMLGERNPRLALEREEVGFAHCRECINIEHLSYNQTTSGLAFVLQILCTQDQLPMISHATDLLDQIFDVQNIGSDPVFQKFRVSGLIVVQGTSSHHFFVIEKVDHDRVLIHDNLSGCHWIPIREIRQPACIWGFILRHSEYPSYSFQPIQYKAIAPSTTNPKAHQCKKRLKQKHGAGVDPKKYEFTGTSKKPTKKAAVAEDPPDKNNNATTPPNVTTPEKLANPESIIKAKPLLMNHRGVPIVDVTSSEQNSKPDEATTHNHAESHHPRVPGDDTLTHHSHLPEDIPLPSDQGTDECLHNLGHLNLDGDTGMVCNPTQVDQPSTSPTETPLLQLPPGELPHASCQKETPLQNTDHSEDAIESSPIKVTNDIPIVSFPEPAPDVNRDSNCPPPSMVDASHFNGQAAKEKEVSPPKRPRFSELHPYAIISLFDGVGSAIQAIAAAVGGPPSIVIAAECDPILRQIVSEQFLFRSDGKWTKSCPNTYTIYTDDVRKILKENCRILREAFFLAGPHCRWIVIAGSPCQDLTTVGPFQGLLGLTGPSSSMFYYVHSILWMLQMNYPTELIRFLVENAGTMLEIHRQTILKALGLNPQLPPDHFRVDPKFSHGIRRNRFFFRNYPDRAQVAHTAGLSLGDQEGPLLSQGGEAIPFGPLLRVRAVMGHDVLQLSWTSYQPIALIWDYTFWGGKEHFQHKAKMQLSDTMPSLSFANALPPHYLKAWRNFLQAFCKRNITAYERDELVRAILPIFHHPLIKAPMRILNSSEVEKLAGLHNHFHRVQAARPLLTEYTIRNYCGNSFHPAHIQAAIGQPERLRSWLAEPAHPSDRPNWQGVIHPKIARAQYHELRDKVLTAAAKQNVKGVAEKQVGLDPMPDFPIHAVAGRVTPIAPAIHPSQILPPKNDAKLGDIGVREDTPPKQLSLMAIQIIKQKQMHDILTGMRFFGAGISQVGDILSFFFGQTPEDPLARCDSERREWVAKQLALCVQNTGSMMQILLFVLTMLHRQKRFTHLVLIVDWEDQAQVHAFGATQAQWTVYCVLFPKSNTFQMDTAAWNCLECTTIPWHPTPDLIVCNISPMPFQCTNQRCIWFALPYQDENQYLVSHRALGTFIYQGCVPCFLSCVEHPAACKEHQANTPYPELTGTLFVDEEGQTAIAAAHDWHVPTSLGYQTCLVRAVVNEVLFKYPQAKHELPNVNVIGNVDLAFAATWAKQAPEMRMSFFVFSL